MAPQPAGNALRAHGGGQRAATGGLCSRCDGGPLLMSGAYTGQRVFALVLVGYASAPGVRQCMARATCQPLGQGWVTVPVSETCNFACATSCAVQVPMPMPMPASRAVQVDCSTMERQLTHRLGICQASMPMPMPTHPQDAHGLDWLAAAVCIPLDLHRRVLSRGGNSCSRQRGAGGGTRCRCRCRCRWRHCAAATPQALSGCSRCTVRLGAGCGCPPGTAPGQSVWAGLGEGEG
jgi:hypothetical protein